MARQRNQKPTKRNDELVHAILRKRRLWLALAFGLFAGLLGGLLGSLFGLRGMFSFGVVGLIMGLLGGWVAASVGMWPRNKNTHYWSTRLLRKVPLDQHSFSDKFEAPDDERDTVD